MAGNLATPGASVAGRLLAVLDCFDIAHPELSLTEISLRSDLPISTARRLLLELVEWGGLERLVDNRYRIGLHLWTLGVLAPQQRGLREAALPLMQDLCTATGENVQLVVLDEGQALCVEKISGKSAVPSETKVGGRLPLHATAVGKCLIAHSPEPLFRTVVDRGLKRRTPYTLTQPGQLVRELRDVRRTGVARAREEMTVGVASVASPIFSSGGVLQGALGVVARSSTNLDRLAPAVLTAALAISRLCRDADLQRPATE